MSVHSTMTGISGGIHVPYQWTFANAGSRGSSIDPNTGSAYVSSAIGKLCFQTDANQLFILLSTTPTWQPVSPLSGNGTLNGSGSLDITLINPATVLVACWGAIAGSGQIQVGNDSQIAWSITSSASSTDSGKDVHWIAF